MSNKYSRIAPSIFLIICMVGLPQISETIYTPALPDIAASLFTSISKVEWTLTTYFIGFALGVSLWGKWSDHIGRRKAMLLGLLTYILGSLCCSLSPSINWLLTGRLIQAFGASVGSVITMTIMRDVFTGSERNKIFSVVAMALAFSPALGPLMGGFIVQWFHWQANFIVLISMGIALSIYCFRCLPETHPNLGKNSGSYNFIHVGKRLLTDKHVLACAFLVGGFNGILFSYYAEAPYLFINLMHYLPSYYGMLGICIALASILGSFISHRLNRFFKPEKIILIGCSITFLSFALLMLCAMSGIIDSSNIIVQSLSLFTPMLGFFIGFGIAIPNILSIALSAYQDVVGTAGSIFGFIYYILIATLLFGMGFLHDGTFLPMPAYFMMISSIMFIVSLFIFHRKTVSTANDLSTINVTNN